MTAPWDRATSRWRDHDGEYSAAHIRSLRRQGTDPMAPEFALAAQAWARATIERERLRRRPPAGFFAS